MNSHRGFTLIEVLISIAVLSVLGVLATQSIRQAVEQKKKLQLEVDNSSRIRDALLLMQRDLELAYHHRDWEKELIDSARQKSNKPQTPPQVNPGANPANPPPPTPPTPPPAAAGPDPFNPPGGDVKRQDPTTNFVGKENEIHFVTLNVGRLSQGAPIADFQEVGYFLKNCKTVDGKSSSQCLWRRSTAWVDDDVEKGGDNTLLLDSVTELVFKYIGRGKQDWATTWRTDSQGDASTQGNFPWAVEISMTMQKENDGKKGKKYSYQVVVPLHFPNNKEEGSGSTSAPTSLPTSAPPTGGGN